MDRPEEPEEVFCTFAMARMLAEALPHVNASGSSATSVPRAVFDSLNRTAAQFENNLLENVLLHDTGSSLFIGGSMAECWPALQAYAIKFET